MLGYRDITWCAAAGVSCSNEGCHRYLTDDDRATAIRWWGNTNFPITLGDLSPDCNEKIPMSSTERKLKNILEASARRLEVELKGNSHEFRTKAAERIAELTLLSGQSGFDEAAVAVRDIMAMELGIYSVDIGDKADAELRGIILGFIVSVIAP